MTQNQGVCINDEAEESLDDDASEADDEKTEENEAVEGGAKPTIIDPSSPAGQITLYPRRQRVTMLGSLLLGTPVR